METLKKVTTAPVQAANLLTVIRAITNLFKHSDFSQWLQLHCSEVTFSSPVYTISRNMNALHYGNCRGNFFYKAELRSSMLGIIF